HTRFSRDWSSDVCSSDLYFIGRRVVKVPFLGIANLLLPESPPYPEFIQGAARPETLARELEELTSSMKRQKQARVTANALADKRSEERRVGKECRDG